MWAAKDMGQGKILTTHIATQWDSKCDGIKPYLRQIASMRALMNSVLTSTLNVVP